METKHSLANPSDDSVYQSAPEGIHVEKDSSSLRISYSLFRPVFWLALAGGLSFIWLGIYLLATGGVTIIAAFCLLLGLILVYSSLVGIINNRSIIVTHDQLKISYGPLPFEKINVLESSQLSQLYTHKMVTLSRTGDITGFTLEAILLDGTHMLLLSDPSYEKTHYLEKQIEAWLGIKDLQVNGEITPHL